MMNYEIKSAKVAKVLEIFFDKNTNKLSYKNLKGIVTSIDTASDLITIQSDLNALESTVTSLQSTVTALTPSYKVYTALLNQTLTGAPVATVLENTLGGTPVWTRTGAGEYLLTLTGAFTVGKTVVFPMVSQTETNFIAPDFNYSANEIYIGSFNSTVLADDVIGNQPIEIRVYA